MANVTVVIVMGVSGCGKSTIGKMLAEKLGCSFLEGDQLHPPANVAKMASGFPLNDEDRLPWLLTLHARIKDHLDVGELLVVSCSALKPEYRNILLYGTRDPGVHPAGQPLLTHDDIAASRSAARMQRPGDVDPLHPEAVGSRTDSGEDKDVPHQHQSQHLQEPPPPPPPNLRAAAAAPVAFVLLDPPEGELRRRLAARDAGGGHFFRASLLDSQLATLSYSEDELFAHFVGIDGRDRDCSSGGGDSSDKSDGKGDRGSGADSGCGGCSFLLPEHIVDKLVARLRGSR